MAAKWLDVTSYSSGEHGKVEPRTWMLSAGPLQVFVTRHIHDPGKWLLRTTPDIGLDMTDTKSKFLDQAQAKAVELTRRQVRLIVKGLDAATDEGPSNV